MNHSGSRFTKLNTLLSKFSIGNFPMKSVTSRENYDSKAW